MKALIGIIALAASLSAAETPSVTGTWNMGLEADHVIPTAFVLKQDGKTLTGTIALPTRDGHRMEIQLSGSIADGAFSLTGTVEGAEPSTIDLAGKLLDEGSLEGTMKSRHGTWRWTAERFKERKERK
jgi:hypothetical protein